jgi:hypothetical protein
MYNHLVSDGIYQETFDTISGLIAQEVSKTSTAKNSAIAMAASKEFLIIVPYSQRSWTQEDALGPGIGGCPRQIWVPKFPKSAEHDIII